MKEYYVDHQKLRGLVSEIFMQHDLLPEEAAAMSDMMVKSNLRGVDSHGVLRVGNYINRLNAGGMTSRSKIEVIVDKPTFAVIDGHNGFGAVVAAYGAKLARAKAKQHGLSMVTVRNTEHTGAIANWALMMAQDDMIGISGTSTEVLLAPTGGKDAVVGNNPFAVAVPSAKYAPICVDMACSTVAGGKIEDKAMKKELVPLGWCLDKEGKPTTDPTKWWTLFPVGGHKGYSIAVAIECLASLLSGGLFGEEHGSQYKHLDMPNPVNSFYMAIDITAFRALEEFKKDVDEFIALIHSSRPVEGTDRVYYPGEIEGEHEKAALKTGLKLNENLIADLKEIAQRSGLGEQTLQFLTDNPV